MFQNRQQIQQKNVDHGAVKPKATNEYNSMT